jgi:hypothetical protein
VEDVPNAVDFYERAFGLVRDHVHEDGSYGEVLASEGVRIGFAADWHVEKAGGELNYRRNRATDLAPGIFIHLVSSDVDSSYAQAIVRGRARHRRPCHGACTQACETGTGSSSSSRLRLPDSSTTT